MTIKKQKTSFKKKGEKEKKILKGIFVVVDKKRKEKNSTAPQKANMKAEICRGTGQCDL